MDNETLLTSSPHLREGETVTKIMWKVFISLLPATFVGIYIFGLAALLIVLVSVLTAMLTEYIFLKVRKMDTMRVLDGSAALTGLILALTLPPTLPLYAVAFGAVVAIALGKQIFGGLGNNIFIFDISGKIMDFFRCSSLFYPAIRGLQKTQIVYPGISAEGDNKTDIRTLRSLYRTDSTIVREMDIPHLKPGSLPAQPSRSEGAKPPLMGQLG